ncbi:RseA family anti-sigma factor [Pantoea sp. Nvir]
MDAEVFDDTLLLAIFHDTELLQRWRIYHLTRDTINTISGDV